MTSSFPVANLSTDELTTLRQMINERNMKYTSNIAGIGVEALAETFRPVTPTSKLLSDAATLIRKLMLGQGVDQRNGWQWEDFVRQLHDRAAAFKACEDEEKS